MYNEIFIKDFSTLGEVISEHIEDANHNSLLDKAIEDSARENPFFTRYMQIEALRAISHNFIEEGMLREWLALERRVLDNMVTGVSAGCPERADDYCKNVGIITAGNIPLVGFHDFLCVLAVGYRAIVKPSSKDRYLIVALAEILIGINSYWKDRIEFVAKLPEDIDMVIASGRSETMEMIKESYRVVPLLLRGSRFSVAVIRSDEDDDSLRRLGRDIFLYFGFGCRNVSLLLAPENYDFEKIANLIGSYRELTDISDYRAAYRYAKAQAIMGRERFIDGGFYILKEEETLPPPLAVIGIKYYRNSADIEQFIELNEGRLQCIVNYKNRGRVIGFGETQQPLLNDYADGVDTIGVINSVKTR